MHCKSIPSFPLRDAERFWLHVGIADDDACWPWLGCVSPRGYGRFSFRDDDYFAHRIAYVLATGDDPGALIVCHSCDSPPCCNPRHLFAGTQFENMRDAAVKGRLHPPSRRGVDNPSARLAVSDVVSIRALIARGRTQRDVAARFGVSQYNVWSIVRRKTWDCVP